jgi:sodium-dependent dicarboxylate transporter 2/3/5
VYPGFTVHSFIIYAAISWFSEGLINWKIIERKMPWELVFLLGGGFALAKGTSESGLSAYLGVQLEALR